MRAPMAALVMCTGAVIAASDSSAQRGVAQPADAAAVRVANSRFAGVWRLVGEDTRDASGAIVPPGPNAGSGGRVGFITYDPAGYMGVTLAWLARPTIADRQPTPPEARAAMGAYNSYWGSFAVNDARRVVTHQTFGALSPAFSGTNQERGFTFSGNRLTLRPPTAANGDQRTLTWERVPDVANLTATHRTLIGFWKLVSLERRNAKNELVSSNPGRTGFLVYTKSGHVMVHLMQPYRRRNVGPSPTPEETMATYRSYGSYFGPYTLGQSGNVVVHHVAGALNPRLVGTDLPRSFELSGRRLTLKAAVTKDSRGDDVQTTATWERLSD
jgi:hypothetical protein